MDERCSGMGRWLNGWMDEWEEERVLNDLGCEGMPRWMDGSWPGDWMDW